MNGQGTFTWYNGEQYVGEWKDDKMNGQGTFTRSNGEQYVGEWKDDNMNGQGTFTWSKGDQCVGEWKDGKMNGQGTYTWSDGEQYIGGFKDGNFHGQGQYSSDDGKKASRLYYRNKRKEMRGIYTTQSQKSIISSLISLCSDSIINLESLYTYPIGVVIKGLWEDGNVIKLDAGCHSGNCMSGFGSYTSIDGSIYLGEWNDGLKHGIGICIYASLDNTLYYPFDFYEGEWKRGKRHGIGNMHYRDGNIDTGKWKRDKFKK